MLRERATRQGRPLVKLGLSEGQFKHLLQGQPILLPWPDAEKLGLGAEILLFCTEKLAETSVQMALMGLLEPEDDPVSTIGPKPFVLRCRSCQTRYLNTDVVCPACGSRAASYKLDDAERWNEEQDLSKGASMLKDRIAEKNDWLSKRIDELDEGDPAQMCLKEGGKLALRAGQQILAIGERPQMEEVVTPLVETYDSMAGQFGEGFQRLAHA